jgi:hypothetical protein
MERLESRIAPSGIVSVSLSHGALSMVGDNAPNRLEFSQIDEDSFQITPLTGTLVKLGDAAPSANPLVVDGVTGAVKIQLRGGLDSFNASTLDLPGDLAIDLGTGGTPGNPETLSFSDLLVDGSLRLKTAGPANLTFSADHLSVDADWSFKSSKSGSWEVALPGSSVLIGGDVLLAKAALTGTPTQFEVGENLKGSGALTISNSAILVGENLFLVGKVALGDINNVGATTLTVGENFNVTTTNDSVMAMGNFLVGEFARINVKGDSFELIADGGIGESLLLKASLGAGSPRKNISLQGNSTHFVVGDSFNVKTSGSGNGVNIEVQTFKVNGSTNISDSAQLDFSATGSQFAAFHHKSGARSDSLTFQFVVFSGPAQISTGAGNDSLEVLGTGNRFEAGLFANLGAGTDSASYGNTQNVLVKIFFGDDSLLLGGKGTDTFDFIRLGAEYTGNVWHTSGFENVIPHDVII